MMVPVSNPRADQDQPVVIPPAIESDSGSPILCLTREQIDKLNDMIDERQFCCDRLAVIEDKKKDDSWKIWAVIGSTLVLVGVSFTSGYLIKAN